MLSRGKDREEKNHRSLSSSYIKPFVPWIFFLILGLITFSTLQISISPDMAEYMNYALNIFTGKGYTNMDGSPVFVRGPVFPLMIVAGYWLLGVSPWSAFWVVRLFSILIPLLAYGLGKKLFNTWVGASSALLIFSSYSMNYWSYRHLDGAWASFAILAILFLYAGLKNESFLYLVLAGLLMGFGFLVKQVTVLLFPLPFVLILVKRSYRDRDQLLRILSYVVTIILLISPWIIYVYIKTSSMKLAVMGIPEEAAILSTNTLDLVSFFKNFFQGLYSYYSGGSQSLAENFIIAPLFVIAWIYTLFKGIRGEEESILLISIIILLSPYVAYVGNNNLRVGQLIIFLAISYLVTARCILELAGRLVGRFGMAGSRLSLVFGVTVVAFLILLQTFVTFRGDRGKSYFIKQSFFYQSLIKGKRDKIIAGDFGKLSKQCGDWISKTLPEGSRLLVSKPVEGKPIYFYSQAKYPIFAMPVIQSNIIPRGVVSKKGEAIIFLSAWTASIDPKNKVFLLIEADLLKCIKENQIDYVVVHKMRNYLSQYFERNASFTKMIEFGNGAIKVYKIDNARPIGEFRMMISSKLITYLRSLMNKDSEKFVWYVNGFFEPLLNWNSEKVKELLQLNSDGIFQNAVVVRENKIYHSL